MRIRRSSHDRMTPAERFERASRFYRRERFAAAARDAERVVQDGRPETDHELRDAARILAIFAYARAREFERGWKLVATGAATCASHLDFCYVACYLAYQRADYAATETWGTRYLRCRERCRAGVPHTETLRKGHEIQNTLGCAAKDRGRDEDALAFFEQAMDEEPAYPPPYINAALISHRLQLRPRADGYLARGEAVCGPKDEFDMIREGVLRDRTISLCMIVRDEEDMLAPALESVRDVVSEIVVVDTGSRDRTVEIAESFGARVFHHAWEDDFARARNQSLTYARGDWILILDADERLDPDGAPLVRRLANACLHDAVAFSVYNVDLDSQRRSFLPSIRMFRNGRGFTYEGIVHNQIRVPEGMPVVRAPVRIDHFGYTPSIAARKGKYERTTRLLERQLRDNPDDAFAHFNLAQILRAQEGVQGLEPQILEHAGRVTELIAPEDGPHLHVLLMAHHQLACTHYSLQQFAAAEAECREALAVRVDYIDALLTLGHVLCARDRFDEASGVYTEYLRVVEAYDPERDSEGIILLHLESHHEACHGLGRIEEARGHTEEALEWYRRAVEHRTDDARSWICIAELLLATGREEEAREALQACLEGCPECARAHYRLGELALRRHDGSKARQLFDRARMFGADDPELLRSIEDLAEQADPGQEPARSIDAARWARTDSVPAQGPRLHSPDRGTSA